MSEIGLTTTTNPTARVFYTLSSSFSCTSAASGSMAVLARKCEISLLTESFGAAFLYLYLGNKAHAAALKVEGRPIPARFRRPVVGFSISIYCYGRVILRAYR